ncbi:NAD-dependent epimerase [Malaciobacter molluscorum]|uniref:NAD-dependent epimerase n=1 Tax=Malaciobacter molluscorum TaxID=1032072 RepID=UPI00100A5339|nr:NAD-dependent epimerase [Malaciobacter molluscorum]RXJ92887.1 NAD-dependent epimerase [Malaciobacter molluscorum]
MKILVTGSAGFIGFHLCKQLLKRGDEVVGIDNINDYYDINLKYARLNELGINIDNCISNSFEKSSIKLLEKSNKYSNFRFIKADLQDKDTLTKLFETEKFDAVCNLAAQAGVRYSLENPDAYVQSNVVGFLNILESCRHYDVKNLCFASSSSVYGLNKSQPFKTTDHTDHPVSLYAATKKSNEMMAHAYAHLYGISTTGLRFFTVYGPWGRPDMAPMLFSDAILNDRKIKVFNHGNMSRDFTYIDDIVDGIIKVMDNPAKSIKTSIEHNLPTDKSTAPYRIYNIGNNAPVRLMDFISTLEKAIGKEAKKEFLPMQDGDVEITYADVSDLINDFYYKPDTNLKDGIEKFVDWYREFYGKNNE